MLLLMITAKTQKHTPYIIFLKPNYIPGPYSYLYNTCQMLFFIVSMIKMIWISIQLNTLRYFILRYLRGTCNIENCPFSHEAKKEKVPVCQHFLRGRCLRDNCPYLHVNVGKDAPICKNFAEYRYCYLGEKVCTTSLLPVYIKILHSLHLIHMLYSL